MAGGERLREWRAENTDRIRDQQSRYRAANADQRREHQRQRRTTNIEGERERERRYNAENRELRRRRERQRRADLRNQALVAYGGRCVRCGSTEDLQLDHVNGDGAQHRREVTNGKSGTRFYRWLRDQGYPGGIVQLLCESHHKDKTAQERRERKAS